MITAVAVDSILLTSCTSNLDWDGRFGLLDCDNQTGSTCKTDPGVNADFDPKESWDENNRTEPGGNKIRAAYN